MDLYSSEAIEDARHELGEMPEKFNLDARTLYNREWMKKFEEEQNYYLNEIQELLEQVRRAKLWDNDDFDRSKYEELERSEREKSERIREKYMARKNEIDEAEKELQRKIESRENVEHISIPRSTTALSDDQFSFYSSVISIEGLPSSLTKIGKHCFADCKSLKHIVVPDSVIEVGDMAFKNCSSLRFVGMSRNATKIGEQAFRACK